MVTIEKVDTDNRRQVNEFIQFQYNLYKGTPQFCPPFVADIKLMLNRKEHPFFQHSDGDFFVARNEKGEIVGRIAILENKPFNKYHNVKKAQFYLFDVVDDQEVADKLFEKAAEWARERGLTEIVGPKGLSAFDGYGILVEGFEHHQMMTMMNYNFPYYGKLLENIGYEKEVDFVSCYMRRDLFRLPEKAKDAAEIVKKRGNLEVMRFRNKKELVKKAMELGHAYNDTFINNWEYYPLSDAEIELLVKNLISIIDPRLVKLIGHEGKIVGFMLAFPDITSALQRHGGRITPFSLIDMLIEMKKTKWVAVNGAGVLPEFQGRGGNALMYVEMEKTINEFGFDHCEMTQVAETAVQMRKDLISLGGQPYKNHRIYHKKI